MTNTDIEDMFAALGSVTIKRMFGGKGIYHQGVILALELQGEIMLKADEITASAFEAAGAKRWSYQGKRNKPVNMPYWSVPAEAFDDPDAMALWVRRAWEAARRT